VVRLSAGVHDAIPLESVTSVRRKVKSASPAALRLSWSAAPGTPMRAVTSVAEPARTVAGVATRLSAGLSVGAAAGSGCADGAGDSVADSPAARAAGAGASSVAAASAIRNSRVPRMTILPVSPGAILARRKPSRQGQEQAGPASAERRLRVGPALDLHRARAPSRQL
jgi:hypothetical protein